MPWILLLGGAFSVGAAALDWNWFFAHPRARLFVRLFGRGGARVAYALLGLALAGVGGLLLVTGADAA